MDDLLIEIVEEVTNVKVEDEILVIESNETGPPGGSLPMLDAADSITLSAGAAYRVTSEDQAILTLPAHASVGDPIEVFGYGLGGWIMPVPDGKVIHILGFGHSTKTDGAGYIKSDYQFAFVRLRCIVQDNEWVAEMYECSYN